MYIPKMIIDIGELYVCTKDVNGQSKRIMLRGFLHVQNNTGHTIKKITECCAHHFISSVGKNHKLYKVEKMGQPYISPDRHLWTQCNAKSFEMYTYMWVKSEIHG